MQITLGSYVLGSRFPGGPPAWVLPAGAFASLDLRPVAEQGQTATASVSALFVFPDAVPVPSGYDVIATDPQETLTSERLIALRAIMQAPALTSTRLADVLYELLTQHADPAGVRCCPPLMPSTRLRLGLWLGHERIVDQPFSVGGPEWPLIQAVLQRQYRQARLDALAGRVRDGRGEAITDFHQQRLQVWLEKYRLDPSQFVLFVPDDLPKTEGPRPHRTTISDNFNGADSGTLGIQLTWAEGLGAGWSNTSNRAATDASGTDDYTARAQSDLSSDDMYSEISMADNGGQTASQATAVVRWSASEETHYSGWSGGTGGGANTAYWIYKCVTTTFTELETFTDTGTPVPATYTVKLTINGSDLELFFDGVSKIQHTDSSFSGHTRSGIGAFEPTGSVQLDNFTAADLTVAPATLLSSFLGSHPRVRDVPVAY